jgi:hypothetical protein
VQQLFEWVGRDRLSIEEVCRRLKGQGTQSPKGKPWWDRTSVWAMLKNPAYAGRAAFGKTRIDERVHVLSVAVSRRPAVDTPSTMCRPRSRRPFWCPRLSATSCSRPWPSNCPPIAGSVASGSEALAICFKDFSNAAAAGMPTTAGR